MCNDGTVTFFIQTVNGHDTFVLYVTKFIQTLFIRNKIYTGQSLYSIKIYT
jgi:hypothetical protein